MRAIGHQVSGGEKLSRMNHFAYRSSRKSNKGDLPFQSMSCFCDGFEDIVQFFVDVHILLQFL